MDEAPPIQLLDQLLSRHEWEDLPLHAQVRRGLNDLIDRYFEDGQKFWPETLLIERLNVSQITVRRALSDLSQAGRLERRIAKGTFVRKPQTPVSDLTTIGVFVPQYNSAFLNEVLEQLAVVCWEHQLRLRVHHTHKGTKTADALHQLDLSPAEQRLILLGQTPQSTQDLMGALHAKGYHGLAIDTLVPGLPGAYVGTDNAAGIRLGMAHLRDLGHRKILLLVNEPEEAGTIRARIAEFEEQMKLHQLTGSRIFHCGAHFWEDSYEIAYQRMSEVWETTSLPTAIFATSDPGAWAALKWLAEREIRVPEEVSVIGFEDATPSRFTTPALTTVAHPIPDIARRAVEMLQEDEREVLFLPPTLVIRESTGPAPVKSSSHSAIAPQGAALKRSHEDHVYQES